MDAAELDEVIALLCQRVIALLQRTASHPQSRILIALAGVPGSGKSTVSAALLRTLQVHGIEHVALFPMDGFHHSKAVLSTFESPETAFRRRGAPFTFDADAFLRVVLSLKATAVTLTDEKELAIRVPSFDHAVQDPVHNDLYISSMEKIVIVEGNYLLFDEPPWNQIASIVDETWFVDVLPEVAKQRLIERHLRAGIEKTREAATARAEENDIPNGNLIRAKLIQPHIVITN